MKRKERKVAWAITEDYSKGIKGHYKLKIGYGIIENLVRKAKFTYAKINNSLSFLGKLVLLQDYQDLKFSLFLIQFRDHKIYG